MKSIILITSLLVLFTSTGCLNDSKSNATSPQPVPATVAPVISDTNANRVQTIPSIVAPATTSNPVSTAGLNPAHGQPGHRCDIAVGAPLTMESSPLQNLQPITTNPAPATGSNALLNLPNLPSSVGAPAAGGSVALNPKHGEPGHRCDIAVGAPLNSQPATASSPAPTTSPTTVVPAVNQNTGGNVKLNPKHGEPGHRCDIQVGAPLTSSPTTISQPAPTSSVPPTTAAPIGAAAIPALQLPNTGASANLKINPKHGEPGHRCDIAVGAALN